MCHQSVGLIARHLEAAGFTTVGLTSARSITASANPPRSVFLDAPLGHTSGPVGDPAIQRFIVRHALDAAITMDQPGTIRNLDLHWHHDRWKADPLGWTRRKEDAAATDGKDGTDWSVGERSGDTRTPRHDAPIYQTDDDRAAAESINPIEQCRTCIGIVDQPGVGDDSI